MVFDEKRGKLNSQRIKCLFFCYCKETKVFMLLYMQMKKLKIRDAMFMEGSTSIGNNFEMHPMWKTEVPTMVVVGKSPKLFCLKVIEILRSMRSK